MEDDELTQGKTRTFITNPKITKSFKDFFSHSRHFNRTSVNVISGILSQLKSEDSEKFMSEMPLVKRHNTELLFSFLMDNFQTYLHELTLELFNFRPEVLAGGSIKNSLVFSHPDIDTLKKTIIEKTVLDLGYRNISDIDKYFDEKFGFKIVDGWLQEKRLARLIQIRNVIAHNRGKINALFISKVGAKYDVEGQPVGIPDIHSTDRYLIDLAQSIDRRAIDKFGLPTYN